MTDTRRILLAGIPLLLVLGAPLRMVPAPGPAQADDRPTVAWAGKGSYRLLVEVEARKMPGGRADERPAELSIDFEAELRRFAKDRIVDIASIQVVRHDPKSGQPFGTPNDIRTPFERPFRWYDAAIPYEFPEFNEAVSRTGERIEWKPRTRGGYFYNVLGDGRSGRLVWLHTQNDDQPARYAVYFDLLPEGKTPAQLPPSAWVGDGTPRCDRSGLTTTAASHTRIDLDDWNDDGLVDVIVGDHTGHLFWWPNLGTNRKPEFRFGRFVFADGKPLDAGLAAAPKVVDWDGDGVKDVLVGTHWNRLLFYRNQGTNRDRRLEYRGPVLVDGKPLELPIRPLERGSTDIFQRDYYPVPETIDWDGDGDLDLLAGGYITGLIFLYENQGKLADGTPRLQLHGPLQAEGKLLNVKYWGAAPCAADLDGDGDLDLLTGNFPFHVRADDPVGDAGFLQYFENVGTRAEPKLIRRSWPGEGTAPRERLATPRVFDWDGDGDVDLVVGAIQNLYLFENRGSRNRPRFDLHTQPIEVPWGLSAIAADRLLDWDGDGRIDLVRDYTIRLNAGAGNPYQWTKTLSVLPPGQRIEHPSKIGDDWFWPYLDDFDRDGKIDILFGDWWGHVWMHRNLSTREDLQRFDLTGYRFRLASGALIKVGPIDLDPARSFVALQGARTVFTVADYDRDGQRDLVIGDTYGKFRYYRNLGIKAGATKPAFAEPVAIGDLGMRGLVETTDWNQDGWPDVIASSANGRVRVFLNQGKQGPPPFGTGIDPGLPPIHQPRVLVGDLNGDGDEDLFLSSTQGSCFVERSFLEHGYARAKLLVVEQAKGRCD
jgi:hypothetical protein